jgi:hypothetical protein
MTPDEILASAFVRRWLPHVPRFDHRAFQKVKPVPRKLAPKRLVEAPKP